MAASLFKEASEEAVGKLLYPLSALQEEDDDWRFDFGGPFSPSTEEEAKEIRVIYFKLFHDYFIESAYESNTLFWIVFPE